MLQVLECGFDGLQVVSLSDVSNLLNRLSQWFLVCFRQFVTLLGYQFLQLETLVIGLVSYIGQFTFPFVFVRMTLRILLHATDVGITQSGRIFDSNRCLLAGCLVLGMHIQDTVLIDVERYLDLGAAAWSGGQAFQIELAE